MKLPDKISVHPADKTHINGIATLYSEISEESGPPDIEAYVQHFIGKERSKIFILTKNEAIIGLLMARIRDQATGTRNQTAAYIGETIVTEKLRGQGYGRMLLNHAATWFEKENVDYVSRWVFPLPE